MSSDYLNLGALALVSVIAIREFFVYLKSKKNGNGFNQSILQELQTMNNNHLESLRKCIDDGNKELRETLHNDFIKVIELLAEIKGRLNR